MATADRLIARYRTLTDQLDKLETRRQALQTARAAVVAQLRDQGATHRALAAQLGISPARVTQLVADAKAAQS